MYTDVAALTMPVTGTEPVIVCQILRLSFLDPSVSFRNELTCIYVIHIQQLVCIHHRGQQDIIYPRTAPLSMLYRSCLP